MQRVLTWDCLVALVVMALVVTKAQDSACLSELVPCLQFINSNQTPSSSCCEPLKSLIKSNSQCLCSLLGADSAARQTGVNMTRAQLLPARCGDKATAASCKRKPTSEPSPTRVHASRASSEAVPARTCIVLGYAAPFDILRCSSKGKTTATTSSAEKFQILKAVMVVFLSLLFRCIWV